MTWDEEEIITQTGRHVRRPQNLDDMSELVGKVMTEQVRLHREQLALRKLTEKAERNSKRPAPVINAGTLSIIVTATTVIVTTIITVLKETGILK